MNANFTSCTKTSSEDRAAEPKYVDIFPAVGEIDDGEVFIVKNHESRYLTHKFHKYPGKFIPAIPRWAFESFLPTGREAWVLDPFVGSGTTLVEASLHGVNGIGLDVDPLARLIAKVKSTRIDPERLESAAKSLMRKLGRTKRVGRKPEIATLSHWFSSDAIERLAMIRGAVDTFEAEPDLHDFFCICFSAVIRRASNADNQTMKTYVSHTLPKKPEDALELFRATLTDYVTRLTSYSHQAIGTHVRVLDGFDARTFADRWQAEQLPMIDLAVTSPPYIKSVDYIYNQMAELFWIGDRWGLATQPQQNEAKRKYMGNDRPVGRAVEPMPVVAVGEVPYWVGAITSADKKLGQVAARYFNDTVAHFRAMSRVMRPNATYVYVVGDSTLAGVSVPTHRLAAQCAIAAGFNVIKRFGYEIRNKHMRFPRSGRGGQVIHDWVLVLENRG
jgi:DNA modification methylase